MAPHQQPQPADAAGSGPVPGSGHGHAAGVLPGPDGGPAGGDAPAPGAEAAAAAEQEPGRRPDPGAGPLPATGPVASPGTGPTASPTAGPGTGPGADGGQEGDGEARAAERSAQRAAALEVAEGFHPLRIRPYVTEPVPGAAGSRSGADAANGTDGAGGTDGADGINGTDGTGGKAGASAAALRQLVVMADGDGRDGPATADLGLFPDVYSGYSGLEYPQQALAAAGDPFGPGPDGSDRLRDPEGLAADAATADRGRHRRRRRGMVIAAATVAASALAAGAVAMTGQVMGDEQGASGHALPDLSSAVPDVTLPDDAGPATATSAPPLRHAAPAATGTAAPDTPSAQPSATRTPRGPSARPTATARGAVTPAASDPTAPSAPSVPSSPSPSGSSGSSGSSGTSGTSGQNPELVVLQLGDSGPAVADLQRRLTEVWVYHGPVDGVFDEDVRRAVATFQVWYWVSDASDGSHDGVYGPRTRATLERQTAHW